MRAVVRLPRGRSRGPPRRLQPPPWSLAPGAPVLPMVCATGGVGGVESLDKGFAASLVLYAIRAVEDNAFVAQALGTAIKSDPPSRLRALLCLATLKT